MIIVAVFAGIAAGWMLSLLGDYLVRFAQTKRERVAVTPRAPAFIRQLRGNTNTAFFAAELIAEIFTACLFALLCVRYGATWQTLWLMLASAFFVLIMIMDYKYRLVLNVLTYPGIVIALAVNLLVLRMPVVNLALGIAFAFGIFYITARLRPNGLGGGDVKLAALIGAAFGFPQVLAALIASAAVSAVTILLLLLTSRKRTTRDTIAYAPFLCLGAIIALIINPALFA